MDRAKVLKTRLKNMIWIIRGYEVVYSNICMKRDLLIVWRRVYRFSGSRDQAFARVRTFFFLCRHRILYAGCCAKPLCNLQRCKRSLLVQTPVVRSSYRFGVQKLAMRNRKLTIRKPKVILLRNIHLPIENNTKW